ncbi:stage III sporulation protein AE [Priestia taiwanensis]|uniref:Stage III sporulation protein AE n=1 Tax=Priestia taiwanensis TaxID=1347902 RepID=A0A917EKJ5_9BACI|nr:stage III sporulation protein AE [Priestia taiwanensis]MBM7361393.1 stage III sporulation protein AE [Priestia taiwanensis]GGE53808.1 stage III sporulation protein AE [Priestia taiwanensis]
MSPVKRFILISFFFALFFSPKVVQATISTPQEPPKSNVTDGQFQSLGLQEVQNFWEDVVTKYGGYLPESQKGSFLEFVKGEKEFSLKEWFVGFLKFIFHEILANGKLLGMLVLLTILSALLQSLQSAFDKSNISKIADAVIYLVLIVVALNSFYVAASYAQEAIQQMINFVIALLPILLALIAATGGVISASFFHPIVMLLMSTSGMFIKFFVLPLLFLATILSIVSTISDQYKVTKLANLLRNISVGALGIFLTIFLGVLSVQGTATAISDGIAIKTAKFVTGNFIPVIGRVFTDAADTVLSASALLKNTIGIAGVVMLLLIVAFPAIKILSIALIYKVAAAILQPLGSNPVISCLDTIGKCVIYVFASLGIVSLMFFLTITVIITAGNITLMFR